MCGCLLFFGVMLIDYYVHLRLDVDDMLLLWYFIVANVECYCEVVEEWGIVEFGVVEYIYCFIVVFDVW